MNHKHIKLSGLKLKFNLNNKTKLYKILNIIIVYG
jgi:hypothetical protein